jgi:hypothetical protein
VSYHIIKYTIYSTVIPYNTTQWPHLHCHSFDFIVHYPPLSNYACSQCPTPNLCRSPHILLHNPLATSSSDKHLPFPNMWWQSQPSPLLRWRQARWWCFHPRHSDGLSLEVVVAAFDLLYPWQRKKEMSGLSTRWTILLFISCGLNEDRGWPNLIKY